MYQNGISKFVFAANFAAISNNPSNRFSFGAHPVKMDFGTASSSYNRRTVSSNTVGLRALALEYSNIISLTTPEDEIAPFVCPPTTPSVFKKLTKSKHKLFSKPLTESSSNFKEAPPTISLLQLDKKLSQIIELEDRLINLKNEFSNDVASWQAHLPDSQCKLIIQVLKHCFNSQSKSSTIINEKLENLKLCIEAIKQRENKQTKLGAKRYEIEQKKKSVDFIHGLNSTDANTLDDELEENFYNFKVVQGQFGRAIKNQLKDLVDQYVLTANYAVKGLGLSLAEVLSTIEGNDDHNEINENDENDPGVGMIDSRLNGDENLHGQTPIQPLFSKENKKAADATKTYFNSIDVHDKIYDGLLNSAEEWRT